ncbi:hypothetical protein ABIE13_003843 [Ottowia thiooxydans]|uniref:Uncharacterized protein n=1 Tax=Ottowia thiooxydans TaxID=219182 RepID=A0ABV2QDU2_9BURK
MKPDRNPGILGLITLTDLLHILLAALAFIAPLLFAWLLIDRSARSKQRSDASKDIQEP